MGYKLRNLTSLRRSNSMYTGSLIEVPFSSLGPPPNCNNQTSQPPHHLGQHCDFTFFVKPGPQGQDTGPVHVFINTSPSRHWWWCIYVSPESAFSLPLRDLWVLKSQRTPKNLFPRNTTAKSVFASLRQELMLKPAIILSQSRVVVSLWLSLGNILWTMSCIETPCIPELKARSVFMNKCGGVGLTNSQIATQLLVLSLRCSHLPACSCPHNWTYFTGEQIGRTEIKKLVGWDKNRETTYCYKLSLVKINLIFYLLIRVAGNKKTNTWTIPFLSPPFPQPTSFLLSCLLYPYEEVWV